MVASPDPTDLPVEPPAPTELPGALRLGSVEVAGRAVQAALSGYSDLPMRRVARAHGAPYAINEVVVDQLVLTQGKGRKRILAVPDDDHPVGGQLMGAAPEAFSEAARAMVDAGYDIVDINFGCPVSKVLGRCRGGFLLSQPQTALQIVESVLQSVQGDVPVTVKMRRGMDDTEQARADFYTILDGAFALGVAAITVHGRTVRQRYDGPSRWPFVAEVKRHVGDRVLLGSGDLFSPFAVRDMMEQTGVDGVTIARGCIGNPFIFEQANALLGGGVPMAPTLVEQRAAIELHRDHALEFWGDTRAAGKTRRHAIKYAALHPEPLRVRDAFVQARGLAQIDAVLAEAYDPARFDRPPRALTPADVVV